VHEVIRPTRLLMYSHDGFGLGNLSRTLKICERLSQEIPSLSILLLTGSPLAHAFRMPARVDYVKLPSVVRRARDQYVSRILRTPFKRLSPMRADLIHAAIRGFRPHIVLVDKVPLGIDDELLRGLTWLRSQRPKTRVILGLRDVLDEPGHVRELWQRRKFCDAIARFFDSVWVFGSPKVYDLVREYDFPPEIAAKLTYCGYLMVSPVLSRPDEVRRKLGIGNGKFVLVTAGGGGDGFELIKTYLRSVRELNANGHNGGEPVYSLLLLGPEMPRHRKERLVRRAATTRGVLPVLDFSTDIPSYMAAADLVVSMGGYNTLCEILALEKRAIVVPRMHPVSEQWIRARRLQELGLLEVVEPQELSTETLAARIRGALFDPPQAATPAVADVLDTQGLPAVSRFVAAERLLAS
jgi:predicted glycosyltransferase